MSDQSSLSAGVPPISPFDAIKHHDEAGDFWSARELAQLLGYKPASWHNFEAVIEQAMEACRNAGQAAEQHFVRTETLSPTARRRYTVVDYHLSRYACYLTIENADPAKEAVALGQTYFAVRTHHDELSTTREHARRLLEEREKLKRYHKVLFQTARGRGVLTPADFAVFEDHGYRGMYHETAEQIAARKGLKPGQRVSDFMGITEMAANGFRAALASEMLVAEDVQDKTAANRTHHRAGSIVRKAMEDAEVPPPEQLPTPPKSIQEIKRDLARQQRIEAEDSIGLWAQLMDPANETPTHHADASANDGKHRD
jgi:DNA-damage-inducible protein D